MSNTILQNQFYGFHNKIKLDLEDNEQLIEKRDMLIEEIKSYLKKKSEDENTPRIKFKTFMQGSYAMGTGNNPVCKEEDYDIDTGLLFFISVEDYKPLEVKRWVFEALDSNQFRTVEWKKACIRVQYKEAGLPKFHIDFACYSDSSGNDDGQLYIAKGKPTLSPDQNKWEVSEPKKLKEIINNKFSDVDEKGQFKRVIRYMKRWKDYQFNSVNGTPTGITITALSNDWFSAYVKDAFSGNVDIDDFTATHELVKNILRQFSYTGRIYVTLPVPPNNDLCEKMTDQQCENFKKKLETLSDAFADAENETDPHEACKILKKQFGDDFPVPAKAETGQNRKKAVVGTSESA